MGTKRFLKRITLRKAATTGATFLGLFVAGMATVEIPDDPSALDKALPAIGIAVIGAAWRAYNNMRKNPEKPGNPLGGGGNVPSGYLLAVAGLAGLLAGCVTTTDSDGNTTTKLDPVVLETARTQYERHVANKKLLEEEKLIAKKKHETERLSLIQAELDKLEPEIRRLAERLGLGVE